MGGGLWVGDSSDITGVGGVDRQPPAVIKVSVLLSLSLRPHLSQSVLPWSSLCLIESSYWLVRRAILVVAFFGDFACKSAMTCS